MSRLIRWLSKCVPFLFVAGLSGALLLDTRLRLASGAHKLVQAGAVVFAYGLVWVWITLSQRP